MLAEITLGEILPTMPSNCKQALASSEKINIADNVKEEEEKKE